MLSIQRHGHQRLMPSKSASHEGQGGRRRSHRLIRLRISDFGGKEGRSSGGRIASLAHAAGPRIASEHEASRLSETDESRIKHPVNGQISGSLSGGKDRRHAECASGAFED